MAREQIIEEVTRCGEFGVEFIIVRSELKRAGERIRCKPDSKSGQASRMDFNTLNSKILIGRKLNIKKEKYVM